MGTKRDDDVILAQKIFLYEKFLKTKVKWNLGESVKVPHKLQKLFNKSRGSSSTSISQKHREKYLEFLEEVFSIAGYGFTKIEYANYWIWKSYDGKRDAREFLRYLARRSERDRKNISERDDAGKSQLKVLSKLRRDSRSWLTGDS